jgi:predicted enzyme related to lactoylglutathione lyase
VEDYSRLVRANGAAITQELADQPSEVREFEVADPDGNALIFGEPLARISLDWLGGPLCAP